MHDGQVVTTLKSGKKQVAGSSQVFCNSITSPCSGLGGRGQCAVAFLMRWKAPGPEDSSTESDIVDKELVAIKNHKVSGSKQKKQNIANC